MFGGGGLERRIRVREQTDPHAASGDTEPEESGAREPLARIGVLYEIPVSKRVVLSPNVSFDFVPGSTVFVETFGLERSTTSVHKNSQLPKTGRNLVPVEDLKLVM